MGTDSGIPFGNYTLLKRIARGGMAEVFVARQKGIDGFDRLVAIKRILPHLLDDQSFIRMFQDEARLAARLSHPNVIHIYDFGKVAEHFFIAMEFMHGVHAGNLIRLAESNPIPPALVARIGANACAGLHYAHHRRDERGQPLKLVHRDVSPPNLLVSYDGVVKVVDFGIAKAVSSIEQTRPGVVKGKYAYMSPEQTMGQPLDGRSDVFSLAMVMWELLAGKPAVTRTDQVLAMKTIRDGKVPSIASEREDLPPQLVMAMEGALARDADDRFDARRFGNALESFIKSSNEIATPMELGVWLTEHFPPENPSGSGSTAGEGTRPATMATSLSPASEVIPNRLLFEDPEEELVAQSRGAVVGRGESEERETQVLSAASGGMPIRDTSIQYANTGDSVVVDSELIDSDDTGLSNALPALPEGQPHRLDAPTQLGTPAVLAELSPSSPPATLPPESLRPERLPTESLPPERLRPAPQDYDKDEATDMNAATRVAGGADIHGASTDDYSSRLQDTPHELQISSSRGTTRDDDTEAELEHHQHHTAPHRRAHQPQPAPQNLELLTELTVSASGQPLAAPDDGGESATNDQFRLPPANSSAHRNGFGQPTAGTSFSAQQRSKALPILVGCLLLAGVVLAGILLNDQSSATDQARTAASHFDAGARADEQPASLSADASSSAGIAKKPANAAVEPPRPTTIRVVTKPPGAAIFLGGVAKGRSPVDLEDVQGGTTRLEAKLEGYISEVQELRLKEGEARELSLELKAVPERKRPRSSKPGLLTVRTRPYSIVYHRGEKLGTTPFANLQLRAGTYRLTFKNPKFKTATRTVVIRPGKTEKLSFKLSR